MCMANGCNKNQTTPYSLRESIHSIHGRKSPPTTQHDRAGDVQDGTVLQGARALHPPLRRPDAARDPPLAHAVRRASRAHTVGRDGPSGARREQGEEGAVAGELQWE